jgi:hypothetical protein
VKDGHNWTTKGKVSKIYETAWGGVMVERHVYQTSAGGATQAMAMPIGSGVTEAACKTLFKARLCSSGMK